ncbi:MAG TPA: serine/threonine-protein kinase [Sandaracinaceae bacterium LLY-WYZ-13_1]|nr:serine/threonine-protein kinase [Sandaracinaceae bacterium LLY-WYZ-13_1]
MSSEGAEQHLRLVDAPEEPVDPLVGETIDGRYEIEKKLGEGGMGVVYKAKHVMLQKDLAMKVLRADVSKDQEIIQRFRQEAQSASAIGSQHIIDISDFGTLENGSTYFVMEFLGGRELTKVIETEQPIAPERVAHVAMQLCDALGAAHDRGIVHRDMKPDNVFLIERGGDPDFVKVLDFGIAKVGGANSKLTKAGQVFGTPHYMSPEQCSGQGVDHRTDIYAIGVILYEMACGKVPFDADNLMGILTKHIYEQPIPLHELPPPVNVPSGLEAVILKCLTKSADQRYQSMAEVKADLQAFVSGQTPNAVMEAVDRTTGQHGRPDPTGRQSALQVEVGGGPAESPSKLPLVLGAAVGLLALAGIGAAVWFLALAPADDDEIVAVEQEPEVEQPEVEEPELSAEEQEAARVAAMEEIEAAADEAEEQVMVTIESTPEGVEVWSADGVLLGNTPFEVPRPAEGNRLELELRQPGYEDHAVPLSQQSSTTLRVSLEESADEDQGSSGQELTPEERERRREALRRARERQRQQQAQQQQQQQAQQQQQDQQQQQSEGSGGSGGAGISGTSEVLDPWAQPGGG